MQPFKISVVTISFNQAAYLQECIDSVARQRGNWEHIIVDAGSTDGSREIIERNKEHFSHIIFEKDEGPADGLNKGFAKATGTHGYFLNSDDFLLPNAFKSFFSQLSHERFDEILLFSGWIIDASGEPVREVRSMNVSLFSLLEGSSIMFQQGLFFSLRVFRQVLGFNASNRTSWDFELLCDLLHQGCASRVRPERIAAFRVYAGTISDLARSGTFHDRRYSDHIRIRSKFRFHGPLRLNAVGYIFLSLKKYFWNPYLLFSKLEKFFRPERIEKKWLDDAMIG